MVVRGGGWLCRYVMLRASEINPRHLHIGLSVLGIYCGYKAPLLLEYMRVSMVRLSASGVWEWARSGWWTPGANRETRKGKVENVSISVDDLQATVEKISFLLSNAPHLGLLVVKGPDFDVVSANGRFRKLAGWPAVEDSVDERELKTVLCPLQDLLPPEFVTSHKDITQRLVERNELPASLRHPLRSVDLMRADGERIAVNLTIAILTKHLDFRDPNSLFYVLISPIEVPHSTKSESWENVAEGIYGSDAAQHVAIGKLPPPEQYQFATVLVFDVVGYTKRCAKLSASKVAQWMTSVHQAVEAVIVKYSVRKIETRGDCYAMVSGTKWVEGDACESQVSRMVLLARDVARELLQLNKTEIRVGLAVGPISVTYIGTHHLAPTLCAFGTAMNEAASLETGGTPGLVHLSETCARRYVAEQAGQGVRLELPSSIPETVSPTGAVAKSLLLDPASNEFVVP
uniref:Guanylate cyclase domain-containing protein n=1 Tax=Hemiselmis andersenii TaxID=464988 RepID=A0A7S0XYT8_HEMAN